jgi:DNA-binding transcriptional LysR family regulator
MGNSFPKSSVLDLDWNDLKFFLAVARTGGLTPASQLLGTSPSTVARHIDALENQLGIKLFLRHQTGYRLTDQGQDVLEPIVAIEQSMLSMDGLNSGVASQKTLRGKVRLATTEGLATHLVVPHLHEFWARYPQVQVELLTSVGTVDLKRREADLALRFINPAEHVSTQDYIGLNLGRIHFGVYCAQHLVGKRPRDIKLLANEMEYISWDEDWATLPMMDWLTRLFGSKAPILTSNNFLVHYHAACAGIGVALLPDYMGTADPRLCELALPDDLSTWRELWLVYHRDLKSSQRVLAMRDFLKDVVQRTANAA